VPGFGPFTVRPREKHIADEAGAQRSRAVGGAETGENARRSPGMETQAKVRESQSAPHFNAGTGAERTEDTEPNQRLDICWRRAATTADGNSAST